MSDFKKSIPWKKIAFLIIVLSVLFLFISVILLTMVPHYRSTVVAISAVQYPAYANDTNKTTLVPLAIMDPWDSSMPYTYIMRYNNSTGMHTIAVYLGQDNKIWNTIIDNPGYQYLIQPYGSPKLVNDIFFENGTTLIFTNDEFHIGSNATAMYIKNCSNGKWEPKTNYSW